MHEVIHGVPAAPNPLEKETNMGIKGRMPKAEGTTKAKGPRMTLDQQLQAVQEVAKHDDAIAASLATVSAYQSNLDAAKAKAKEDRKVIMEPVRTARRKLRKILSVLLSK